MGKMNYTQYPMFQVPLLKIHLNNWKIKQKKILDLLVEENLEYDSNGFNQLRVKTNFHYFDEDKKEKETFCKKIESILEEEFNFFRNQLSDNSLFLKAAWHQVYGKNNNHAVHNHGALGYSFVCFVKYDNRYHSSTTFLSPFNSFDTGEIIFHSPSVVEGDLIIFPSAILHEAPLNNSDVERVILSGNIISRKIYE